MAKTIKEAIKHIENFRFDEASRVIYQFVWHSFCDWYIEFLKPIFDSNDRKNLDESRNLSAFIQANILTLLHPFIPFFTEKIWQDSNFESFYKKPLMYKDWNIKPQPSFAKKHVKIDWLIDLITNIRVTKVNLSVPPGSFIEISTNELNPIKRAIIDDNLDVFKRLGRVSNVIHTKLNKNGVKIIVGGETLLLYFDQNLDLKEQKIKISDKVESLLKKVNGIEVKLRNKSFIKNAPKHIIDSEKKALLEYKNDFKKLNSILNSIKD